MKTKTLRQTVTFKAPPSAVFGALMNSRKHATFTGAPASISRKVGGAFSVYDGYATGVNLELVPNERIIQTWRANDWPAAHFSKVTFAFAPTATGTRLSFTHSGVPEEQFDAIKQGWTDFYWKPMKAMFEA